MPLKEISETSRKLLSPPAKFSMQPDLCLFILALELKIKRKVYQSHGDVVRYDRCTHLDSDSDSDTNCPSIIAGSSEMGDP